MNDITNGEWEKIIDIIILIIMVKLFEHTLLSILHMLSDLIPDSKVHTIVSILYRKKKFRLREVK